MTQRTILRTCIDCGVPIQPSHDNHTGWTTSRCPTHLAQQRDRDREAQARYRAKKKVGGS